MDDDARRDPGKPVSDFSLWLGAFGAAGAWTVHLLFGVAFGSASCVKAGGALSRFDTSWWILTLVTVVLLAVAVSSTLLSVRNLHRLGVGVRETEEASEEPGARAVFLAFAGLLLGGMFLVALGFSAVAGLSVPFCW
jgi:hypothetical protein